jgi:hypothetical protein
VSGRERWLPFAVSPRHLVRLVLEDRRRTAVAAGLIVLAGAIPALAGRLQPDTAWLLYASDHMLRGSRLYVDLIETNPPLIVWLDAVPVLAGRLLGIASGPMFIAMTLALALGSVAWCARLLGRLLPEAPLLRRCLVLLILVALVPLAREDFGQREHLFLVLALPYVLLAVLRLRGLSVDRSQAWAIGAMAGIGIALKPYFVLLWLAVELITARTGGKARRPRAETVAIMLVGVGYLGAVAAFAPEYWDVVHTMARPYYTFLRNPLLTTALLGDGAQLPVAAFLAYLTLRRDAERRPLWTALAWSMAALWVGAVLQQKGWRYHFYPSLAVGLILCGLMIVDRRVAAGSPIRRLYAAVSAAAVLGMTLLVAGACLRQVFDPRNPRYDPDPDLSRLIPVVAKYAGQPVLMLSWSTASAFPLMTYGKVESASRFNHLWVVGSEYWKDLGQPGPLRYHTREEMSSLERFLIDALVEDMARNRPPLALVLRPGPDRPEWGLRRLDFLGYFNRDPRFARLWAGYTYDRQVGEYWIFRRARPGEAVVPPPARPVVTRATPARGLDASFGAPALEDVALWIFSALLLGVCLLLQSKWDRGSLDGRPPVPSSVT